MKRLSISGSTIISLGRASHGITPAMHSTRACWARRLRGLDKSVMSSLMRDEET